MKTALKIVDNLIIENIFPLHVSSLRPDGWYLGIEIFVKIHILLNTSFNISISIELTTLSHILNGYDISLNSTNYLIFNMFYLPVSAQGYQFD